MNDNLRIVLSEYDQKRTNAISKANKLKYDIYNKHPDLEKIEHDINSVSISLIKMVLTSTDKSKIDKTNSTIESMKKQRDSLLNKYGYKLDVFYPHFECSKCEDTGYISSSYGKELCSCVKQRIYNMAYNNSNIYDLSNQNFNNFRLDLYSDEPNIDKYKMDISPRENMISILNISKEFVNNFDDPNECNLLFCGNTGLGKTFLSSCIANELINKGKTVLYQTAPIMLDQIIDYKFGKSSDNISKSILSVDLLIIDDLGTETKNSYKITELFNIINSRLLNQNNKITKTIISTNLSLQNLYDTYEERIISRIIGNYNACYFYGDDIRIKKKVGIS